ncbi:pollen Ole e 1 allergen and extensin family protein [Tasmannia lanceolata]|uniref:pollen Ole e 1 allergen and extensin family protein n=1 Tax=Tasmannia lanceolata TaxID=3420 RepID=UPI0040638562
MEFLHKLLFLVILLLSSSVKRTRADAMMTGSVFCDQCKDGQRSLFDYPLYGAKVEMACTGSDGQVSVWTEQTTNWFGNYAVRFSGSPDLTRCSVQVMGSGSGCGAVPGPARGIRHLFSMFNMDLYSADLLISQPLEAMSFCPRWGPGPGRNPTPATPVTPPVTNPPKVPSPVTPPTHFWGASGCPYGYWTMPEYKCYWKVVGPDMKVAVAFGLPAARKYGTDMTLWEGLTGRGELYRTLLREGTTALLNSYNNIQFMYPTPAVVYHMNLALLGSRQQALQTAFRFKMANSGGSNAHCNFTPCK